MSSAAAVQLLTPADLEVRLAALGIPVARLIAAAHIARSTWSAWRAGRTRPRPDRWSAVTEAFAALVAEAEPTQRPAPAEADGVVSLTGCSSPTAAPPHFTPIATALQGADAEFTHAGVMAAIARYRAVKDGPDANPDDDDPDHDPETQARIALERLAPVLARRAAGTLDDLAVKAELASALGGPERFDYEHLVRTHASLVRSLIEDARQIGRIRAVLMPGADEVEAAAERVAVLARQEWAAAASECEADDRAASAPSPRRLSAARAALRLMRRLSRRLRRDALALAGMQATDPAAVAAKARAVLAIGAATDDDPWWAELRDAVVREAAGLGRALPLSSKVPASLAPLSAEWVRSCSEDWCGDEALDDILDARDDARFERLKIQADTHREVLWRIADLRSTSPDVLALKAAVVLAGCRDLAELDTDIARRDGTSRSDGEIAVALSLVRDIIALHGDPVRHLVAAVAVAAQAPIAAEVAPGQARAAA